MTGKIAAIDISGNHLLQNQTEVSCFTWQIPLRHMTATIMRAGICAASKNICNIYYFILMLQKLCELGLILWMRKNEHIRVNFIEIGLLFSSETDNNF